VTNRVEQLDATLLSGGLVVVQLVGGRFDGMVDAAVERSGDAPQTGVDVVVPGVRRLHDPDVVSRPVVHLAIAISHRQIGVDVVKRDGQPLGEVAQESHGQTRIVQRANPVGRKRPEFLVGAEGFPVPKGEVPVGIELPAGLF